MTKILIGLIFIFSSTNIFSKSLGLDKVYFETEKHVFSNRDYYLPNYEQPRYGLNLGIEFEFNEHFYNDIKVLSRTGERQFRFVGLETETGIHLGKYVDIYFRHFSGHALDADYLDNRPYTRFPEANVFGIRLTVYKY